MLSDFLRRSSPATSDRLAQLAYPVLMAFKRRIDPRRYNGATLIGLKGVVVKSHGCADVLAFATRSRRPMPKWRTGCWSASRRASRRCRCPAAPIAGAPRIPSILRTPRPPMRSRIAGTGRYLPAHVMTNAELAERIATSDEWIRTRTGIAQRHIAARKSETCDLALAASQEALAAA